MMKTLTLLACQMNYSSTWKGLLSCETGKTIRKLAYTSSYKPNITNKTACVNRKKSNKFWTKTSAFRRKIRPKSTECSVSLARAARQKSSRQNDYRTTNFMRSKCWGPRAGRIRRSWWTSLRYTDSFRVSRFFNVKTSISTSGSSSRF